MNVGIDASRAFVSERTGTEKYSLKLLEALGKVDDRNRYIMYTRTLKGLTLQGGSGGRFAVREIGWPRLWTQGGLAARTWVDRLDVLFIPAHTLPVLRRPRLKTVVTIHGLEYEYLPQYYQFPQKVYLTWSTRYAVRSATRLIAVSRFTASELVSRMGADSSKIRVIHEGVDALGYSKSYSDNVKHSVLEGFGVRKPYVLFVGVVQPRKNLVRLVEAFSLTVNRLLGERKGFPDLTLVIAGKLGWMVEETLKAPQKFGVADRVKFLGFVEDKHLPFLMQEAELLVQPSLTEGFGLPVLEAMAAGTPVVAARAGALPEVCGDAAILVDPVDVVNIADGLFQVLTHKEMRRMLTKLGLERVKQFTWEKAGGKTLEVLEEAVGESR